MLGAKMLRITKVKYLGEYKLQLTFSDKKTKIVDLEKRLFEGNHFYFDPLRNIEFFKQVARDESKYSICWPNGADFSPDTLYKMGKEIRTPQKKLIPSRTKKKITKK